MKKIITLLLVVALISGCDIGTYFQQRYYKTSYQPVKIESDHIEADIPNQFVITDIPCISYKNAYCQSTSLQMITASRGLDTTIHYYNWLMGFTYGSVFTGTLHSFLPYNDPELGFINASPYLGLKRIYYITDDQDLYTNFIKQEISKKNAIRTAINSAALSGQEGFYPHSILLIGFSADSIYYYETGKENRVINNYRGETASWKELLTSIESIGEQFKYPWKYNATVFEKANIKTDVNEIWKVNGEFLKGIKEGPVSTGAKGLEELSKYIADREFELSDWKENKWKFEAGAYTRLDNSEFLKRVFPKEPEVLKAAELLYLSGKNFEKILQLIEDNIDKQKISDLFLTSAKLEEEAGEIFIKHSKKNAL